MPHRHVIGVDFIAQIGGVTDALHGAVCHADGHGAHVHELEGSRRYIRTGYSRQQFACLGACDLKARPCVGNVGNRRTVHRILLKPALMPPLCTIAGGQLKFIVRQTGHGKITDDLARMCQHRRQAKSPRFRDQPCHDPVKPRTRIWTLDQIFAEILHFVDAHTAPHSHHLLASRLPRV